MPMPADDIKALICDALPGAQVEVRDLAGDGDHYAVEVVWEDFRGRSKVWQHRRVYDALGGRMGDTLHAMALKTMPPSKEEE